MLNSFVYSDRKIRNYLSRFCTTVSGRTAICMDWILIMPLLHFLNGDSEPFKPVTPPVRHNHENSKWWGFTVVHAAKNKAKPLYKWVRVPCVISMFSTIVASTRTFWQEPFRRPTISGKRIRHERHGRTKWNHLNTQKRANDSATRRGPYLIK